MSTSTSLSSKVIDKALKKSIKKVLYQRGMTKTTRKGSKELNNLTRRIAQEPFESLEAVGQLGEQLGAEIAEFTQQQGGDRLYQGAVRQLVMKGTVQPLVARSTATPSPQEEAAINTAALPTEAETSGEPEPVTPAAQMAQSEPLPEETEASSVSPSEPEQLSEEAEPSVSASVKDSPEELPEDETSENLVSELEEDETVDSDSEKIE
ncbi:MAG: hypothetical protein ACFB4I_21695 [Cyanophyceae cyanobacterium]